MRVKCLAQEHNTMTRPGLEPGLFDPESSALSTRLTCFSQCFSEKVYSTVHCISFLFTYYMYISTCKYRSTLKELA